jgi:hypothetical protein
MSLLHFCTWLSETSFSVWLRQAPFNFPVLIILHVIAIALFGGVVVMGNLRVLGYALRSLPVSRVLDQFRPWKWVGFVLLLVTGILIMISDPMEYYDNIMNWIKIVTLLLTGVNALIFHYGAERTVADWEEAPVAPSGARGWAIRSLVLWITLVFMGRATAFF